MISVRGVACMGSCCTCRRASVAVEDTSVAATILVLLVVRLRISTSALRPPVKLEWGYGYRSHTRSQERKLGIFVAHKYKFSNGNPMKLRHARIKD